jgi:siderophore synthetase component
MLDAVRARHDHLPGGRHLSTLLRQPELPAKANLTSLLAGHSEHPAYVTIPNPLARGSPDP